MATVQPQNVELGTKKYQSLIVSIGVFLSLIGALLAFTFYTSSLLERNTALINTSHRAANDAQAVIKDIFDLQVSYGEDINSPHIQTVLKRLGENSKEIDVLLNAMETGEAVADEDGHKSKLPKINNPDTLAALKQAQAEWALLKPKLMRYLEIAGDIRVDSSTRLAIVGEQAKTSSLAMDNALQDLTHDIFETAEAQASNIRTVQIVGVVAILIYFLIFILFFVRRLRDADLETEAARRETTEIMDTVNTGLFLLDKELNIGQQYSKALEQIIGSKRLSGENITNVLRGRISDKDLNTTRQFIEQLYNPRVKEKLVDDLNPLKKVMFHDESGRVGAENRYLDFQFSRVYENQQIARILVNVNDVSEAVRLEQRLEKERVQNDLQIEMLTTILNVSPKIIREFIENTKSHIDRMNNILKSPGSSQSELETKLSGLYREMHSLKGEASALKLHSFTTIANEAEEKLKALQHQGKLSGNDFLPLTVQLDGLLNLSNTIETLGARISSSLPNSGSNPASQASTNSPKTSQNTATEPQGEEIVLEEAENEQAQFYQNFAQEIAGRQGKLVELNINNLANVKIPDRLNATVKEICIQLLRNAIVHGIEKPEQRFAASKPEVGNINLSFLIIADSLRITFEDDGRGIDYEAIRQKLIEQGEYDPTTAAQLSQGQLMNALFKSGFSTRDTTDEDGGRGVGLDVIRDRVKQQNGQMNVYSDTGKKTQFVITFPL